MQRYEPRLHRYVACLIHDPDMAHDVVQDTFIKAYRNLRSYSPKHSFSPWIYRIAHNEAMNLVKKERHSRPTDATVFPDESYDAHLDELIDRSLIKEHVRSCLAQLDPKYREIVQLLYFEGMHYSDASDVLRIPPSTVGVRLMRAKTLLRAICRKKGVTGHETR